MADLLVWAVGARNPSITENITVDGVAFDLSSSTVRFKMRAVNSTTLKVDAAATIVLPATAGNVRYDWAAADVDTAGTYLVWWEVTTSSKVQAVGEAVIEFRAHAPLTNAYVEVEEFKKTLTLSGTTFADLDAEASILAASRAVDKHCDRRFWADTGSSNVRYYTPLSGSVCRIDDLTTLTSLKVDQGGDGTFEETWTLNTDFVLQPLNAAADGWPWTRVEVNPSSTRYFPAVYPRTVEVTGTFGWAAVPPAVKQATSIMAHTLLKRSREAPFSVVGVGLDNAAVRIPASDPHVRMLLAPFVRHSAA